MAERMPLLVTDPAQVQDSHATYWTEMATNNPSAALIDVIPYIHSWLAFRSAKRSWEFSPSKFIGYRNISVAAYNEYHKALNGRQTERVLGPWLAPLNAGEVAEAHEALTEFCAKFGKRPNGRFRIMRLANSEQSADLAHDRDATLTRLVIELARTLPLERQIKVSRLLRR